MRYLDAATAVPLHPAGREALLAALADGWADPGRLYGEARRAGLLLEAAREAVADGLGARPDEVSFTGSGAQAVHAAVLGGLAGRRRAGSTFVRSAVEHSAVLAAGQWHVARGGREVEVPVSAYGRADPQAYASALAEGGVGLAALQSANHEVGTLQPAAEVAELCREHGVPLLVDAAQSVGRAPLPAGWSLLTASARKWGGPPGIGVLAVRKGVRWTNPYPVDDRSRGRDSTADLPGVVAAAAALRAVLAEREAEDARLRPLVDRIRAEVPRRIEDVEVVGDPVDRLPHLVTFSCLYVDGEALLTELDRRGWSASSGSSCTASTIRPSHVLEAMGVLSHGNLRVSLHRDVTEADVAEFLDVLPEVVGGIRRDAGVVGL